MSTVIVGVTSTVTFDLQKVKYVKTKLELH